MNTELKRIGAVLWKDLTAERRAKANYFAIVFFAVTVLLLFAFALGPDTDALRAVAAGVLWLAILLSGVLSFNRSYEREIENGAIELLLLYPGDRRSIFIGKLIANLLFVLGVEAILIPLAALLYDIPIAGVLAPLALILLLGTVGFVTLGTLYAAMASRLRSREVLLPLLLFPMLVPLLVAAVHATRSILTGDLLEPAAEWMKVLVIFDAVFLVGALFAFEYVIEE